MLQDGNSGAFAEELLGHALQMSSFKQDSSDLSWDCSAWVRTELSFCPVIGIAGVVVVTAEIIGARSRADVAYCVHALARLIRIFSKRRH